MNGSIANGINGAPPHSEDASLDILVIGGGSRGNAYANAIAFLDRPKWRVRAIAEPDLNKRRDFVRRFIRKDGKPAGPGEAFSSWEEYVDWEQQRRRQRNNDSGHTYNAINTVFICCLDSAHHPAITALAPMGYHILCEKPLCTSLSHALDLTNTLATAHSTSPKAFSIGHVLRYSPFNQTLRKLLTEDLVIGEVVSMEHTEPIGWWHFPHSYVRGNWRREFEDQSTGAKAGSLLTKSCHDIDVIMWLLTSPSTLNGDIPHEPSSITSSGALSHFRRARKPAAAGGKGTTNCLKCPLQDQGCAYSAKRFYGERLANKETHWPINILIPDIEEIVKKADGDGWSVAQGRLHQVLSQDYDNTADDAYVASRNWFGRCVYESDNNVVDNQTVVLTWDEDPLPASTSSTTSTREQRNLDSIYGRGPKTAVFHMTYPTQAVCQRRGHIYGTLGEITYDSETLTIYTFANGGVGETITLTPKGEDITVGEGHGGGDLGLATNFLEAANAIERGRMSAEEAQRKYIGCDVDEIVRSHAVVFAAEEARLQKSVVQWHEWWESKTQTVQLMHDLR